ncbi:MAG: hypothetical protein WBQ72_14660 [Terriglobales bacterium]|jgi:hypothetical protein
MKKNSKKQTVVLACLLLTAVFAVAQTSLPTGTAVKMKLDTTLATFSSKAGDPFSARVTEAVVLDGKPVIPVGATIEGRVTKSSEPRRIAGKPTIAIFPENLVLPTGERFMLNATLVDTNRGHGTDVNTEGQYKGAGHDGKDLTEIGMGTGGGMLIGGLIGGAKGMVIGGAVAATATVSHWLGKHRSAALPAGTELVMELNRPIVMTSAPAGQ